MDEERGDPNPEHRVTRSHRTKAEARQEDTEMETDSPVPVVHEA